MRNGLTLRFLLSLAIMCTGFSLASELPDVRKLMTPEELQAAGVNQLSAEQIEALNRWLLRYTAKEAPELRQHNDAVREEVRRVDTEAVRTRIVGEFRGWDGDTLFHLENGQIWKQRLSGSWYHRADSPEVELKKNSMGFWILRVVAADRAVGVARVQ